MRRWIRLNLLISESINDFYVVLFHVFLGRMRVIGLLPANRCKRDLYKNGFALA